MVCTKICVALAISDSEDCLISTKAPLLPSKSAIARCAKLRPLDAREECRRLDSPNIGNSSSNPKFEDALPLFVAVIASSRAIGLARPRAALAEFLYKCLNIRICAFKALG